MRWRSGSGRPGVGGVFCTVSLLYDSKGSQYVILATGRDNISLHLI